jgi:predicted metal-dependent hydrolase
MNTTKKEQYVVIGHFRCKIIQNKRYRSLRLSVTSTKELRITAPHSAKYSIIENFILSHSTWITDRFSYIASLPPAKTKEEEKEEYLMHRGSALAFATKLVETYSLFYGVRYKKITIKKQKTLWGSCSRDGNLTFNYKIIKLPQHLATYIVIHEVCHLLEFNHSKRFWGLVERSIPNYSSIKKELRNYEKKPS